MGSKFDKDKRRRAQSSEPRAKSII